MVQNAPYCSSNTASRRARKKERKKLVYKTQHNVQTRTCIPNYKFLLTLSLFWFTCSACEHPLRQTLLKNTPRKKTLIISLITFTATAPPIFWFTMHRKLKSATRPLCRCWPFTNKQSLCVCPKGKISKMQADTKLSAARMQQYVYEADLIWLMSETVCLIYDALVDHQLPRLTAVTDNCRALFGSLCSANLILA